MEGEGAPSGWETPGPVGNQGRGGGSWGAQAQGQCSELQVED